MFGYEFYVDPSRCIGCQSCVEACEECETHRGVSMINFDYLDRHEMPAPPRTFAGIAKSRPARWSAPRMRSKWERMASCGPH